MYRVLAAFTSLPTKENLDKLDQKYNHGLKTGNYCHLFNALKEEESLEVPLLWRRARAQRLYAINNLPKADSKLQKTLLDHALQMATMVTEADPECSHGHKWKAILLSDTSELEGPKAQLLASPAMKQHFEKAVELDPTDSNTIHALGCWHYSFANMNWIARNFASSFLAKVPKSTYEEALKYFEQAEAANPGFYTANWLHLCYCYKQLKMFEKYEIYRDKLLAFEPRDKEEQEALDKIREIIALEPSWKR